MPFELAHLSDAHIGPLPKALKRELISKRITGFANWAQGRSRTHNMTMLGRIVADLRAQRPDHIAMTGDILNLGLSAEFPMAKAWLSTLGSPEHVSFTPGNHDAYTRDIVPLLHKTFAPWTNDNGHEHAQYPYMRVRGQVAIIGLSTGVPTAPFLATGTLGRRQREALVQLLQKAGRENLFRVILIHHPPYRGAAKPGRHLTDAAAFEAIIAEHGADLILHGHNHRQQVSSIKTPTGMVPVVGVASSSAIPGSPSHRAAYHIYSIDGEPGAAKITAKARGLLADRNEIGDLGEIKLR
ncbi:MAG: metallophosphoesterase [Hyphomicrobiales bacterium]|nr:metallophosphoesterase [Hyphomicrobiales bacterium]MDE2114947.1 metallophosphoesterase [Hyphomicrobiales bacterium]